MPPAPGRAYILRVFREQNPDFARLTIDLPAIQSAIRDAGLGGWLLYDVQSRNHVATRLLGQPALSRRWFVLLPREGVPIAITHGIEQGPWAEWPWEKRVYVGWQELDDVLHDLLWGLGRVAMEYSEGGAVPILDLVPAGVVDMVRAAGVDVVTSGDLVARFHSAWTPEQLRSHRKTSALLAQVAHVAFRLLAREIEAGGSPDERTVRAWVIEELAARGVADGADAVVATGHNASDPHYSPNGGGAVFRRGDLVLLDLWGRESTDAVFADQTWMACLGPVVPERAAQLFDVIRGARDAAVAFLERAWREGRRVQGREVDDVARGVVRDAGFGQYFIHRTGHSIDTATHGLGPNIDNLETRDDRHIIEGIGFTIEPGIYIPGEIGLRTEIDVYMGESGPEVTTPDPQDTIETLLGA